MGENTHSFAAGTLLFYCLLVMLASLAGGWVLMGMRLVHSRLQTAVSFVAGLMLGMALLHFIPHSFHMQHSLDKTAMWALTGFLVMFFLQRFFQYHRHDAPEADTEHHHDHEGHACGSHDHGHPSEPRQLHWGGVALGFSLHSVLDGLALAAAVASEASSSRALVGLGAALAIILHKPFDALAISTLMSASGCSPRKRHWVNFFFALVCPLGALLFYFGVNYLISSHGVFVGWALAFCAGTFLCIAGTDLLPELQFHSHDRLQLSLALLAGIAVAVGIGRFENSGHDDHDHSSMPAIKVSAVWDAPANSPVLIHSAPRV